MSAGRAHLFGACRTLCFGAFLAVSIATPGGAQSYRVRLDAQAQSVAFRGLQNDSIAAADVVTGTSGGPETPDGFAVRCTGGSWCYFLRPGPTLSSLPVSTSGSVAFWGLGVEGLAVHATARVVSDFGRDEVWPSTDPAVQLLEGYLELRRRMFVARAGRLLLASRLDPLGFDGGWIRGRWERADVEMSMYGGWGLGQAVALPVTSPTLNPLDEWRPSDRQLVAGGEAAWSHQYADVRAEYRREVDPRDDYFVSERAALSLGARVASLRLDAGLDYNLAEDHLGSADAALSYVQARYTVAAGVRRYRPYFSLWTLWGAFSPVPYHALNASVQWRPTPWLTLQGRGERYRYADAEVSTALTTGLEDRGWRASAGATFLLGKQWTFGSSSGMEHGPGAAARFADATLSFIPSQRLTFDLYGGTLARPLELRFYDARSRWIGGRAEWNVTTQRRLWTDVALVEDDRNRPDAASGSLSQIRARFGLSVALGSGADRTPLPPARPLAR